MNEEKKENANPEERELSPQEKLEFMTQRTNVLLEDIKGEFRGVADGHKAVVQRLGEVEENVKNQLDQTKRDLIIIMESKFDQQAKDMMNALGDTKLELIQKIDGTNHRIDNMVGALKTHGIAVVEAR